MPTPAAVGADATTADAASAVVAASAFVAEDDPSQPLSRVAEWCRSTKVPGMNGGGGGEGGTLLYHERLETNCLGGQLIPMAVTIARA